MQPGGFFTLRRSGASAFRPEDDILAYFPPLSRDVRARIRRLVREANDEEEAHEKVASFCAQSDELTGFCTRFSQETATIRQNGRDLCFPRGIPPVKFVLIAYGYLAWLERKYAMPGFCEVTAGDIVFDCGAYIGGFSMSVADTAGTVYSFEPAPLNFRCLERNAAQFPNIHARAIGLGRQTGPMRLNLSKSSVEHSFLAPDRGASDRAITVDVRTARDVVAEAGLTRVDFFKIEAEGFEIEVFQGLGDLRPRKIAIDVSPERDRESPAAVLHRGLTEMGYDVRLRRNVLFAVLT